MKTSTILFFASLLVAACGGGNTSDMDPAVRQSACMQETAAGTAFMAGPDAATAVMHQVTSSGTPYAVTLPTGADGYVGFHVSEMHTTIDIIVKQATDVGAITEMGGMPSDILFDHGGIAAGVTPVPSCSDLFIYRVHIDAPGDFEIQLPTNAANKTWMTFEISQIGHDLT